MSCRKECPGWVIMNGNQIQRCDDCGRFETDEEAVDHVWNLETGPWQQTLVFDAGGEIVNVVAEKGVDLSTVSVELSKTGKEEDMIKARRKHQKESIGHGDECPLCKSGTLGLENDVLVCRGECGEVIHEESFEEDL